MRLSFMVFKSLQIRRALLDDVSVWSASVDQTLTSNKINTPNPTRILPNPTIYKLCDKRPTIAPTPFMVNSPHPPPYLATRGNVVRTGANYCPDFFSDSTGAVIFCFLAGFFSDIMSMKSLTF